MSLPAKVRPIKAAAPDTYHGIRVLALKVDDPIPTPRAPERYAVRIYPDLARYLLTLNHPDNRGIRVRAVAKYAEDMRAGLWWFTPESLVFSTTGHLHDGQHRLVAAAEYGSDVWMMCDFGWPDGIINAIDRGIGRTNSDAFAIESVPNPAVVAGAMAVEARYLEAVGTTRGYSTKVVISAQRSLALYRESPDSWQVAVRAGSRAYERLDRALSPSVWAAAYHIIADAYPVEAEAFFEAVIEGSEEPTSASRVLGNWVRRHPIGATRTGDKREPLEIIIRGFNAWRAGRQMALPKAPGFTLSRVR